MTQYALTVKESPKLQPTTYANVYSIGNRKKILFTVYPLEAVPVVQFRIW